MTDHCPCGSGRNSAHCCAPLINAMRPAPTPEALMRSRFTAYATGRRDYIEHSWHSSTLPSNLHLEAGTRWTTLTIVDCADGADENEGFVEFIAHCLIDGKKHELHERSRFLRENGAWRYVDGVVPKHRGRKATRVGRNDPCPCGSGKKHKKCCGAA